VDTSPGRLRREDALLDLVASAARGPRQEGLFALWLVARVAADFRLDPPLPDRQQRRRVTALERRLASLTLPSPFRRAVAGALAAMRDVTVQPAVLLSQLVAPVRESVSAEGAEWLAELAAELGTRNL
jgi:hypothetical protein